MIKIPLKCYFEKAIWRPQSKVNSAMHTDSIWVRVNSGRVIYLSSESPSLVYIQLAVHIGRDTEHLPDSYWESSALLGHYGKRMIWSRNSLPVRKPTAASSVHSKLTLNNAEHISTTWFWKWQIFTHEMNDSQEFVMVILWSLLIFNALRCEFVSGCPEGS